MDPFEINSGTFPSQGVWIHSGDCDVFKNFLTQKGFDSQKITEIFTGINNKEALTFCIEEGYYCIWFFDFKLDPNQLSVLSHECFHLVELLFDDIGIIHNPQTSSEAFAYQLQHFVFQILQRFMPT